MQLTTSFRPALLILVLILGMLRHAQAAPGDVDLSFDPAAGVDGPVHAMVVQPDGKVIIGGQFSTVRGLTRTNLARLNRDGSGDATFRPGRAYEIVSALALQMDGKVLVGSRVMHSEWDEEWGYFEYYTSGVTRLHANGSVDDSFALATGTENSTGYSNIPFGVNSITVQSDDKVLVGGGFGTMNGVNRNGLARLNADGTLDGGFNPGSGIAGHQAYVSSVRVQEDGKVLVGGSFTAFAGMSRNGIARLDANGTLDGSFNPGAALGGALSGLTPRVESIVMRADGSFILGGFFSVATGNSIARFSANGTLDTSFSSGTGANGVVSSVALQSDGRVLVAGYFTAFNNVSRNRVARLNANGSLDSTFDPGTGMNAGVTSVLVQADGRLLVAGLFTNVSGTDRRRVARLNSDGSLDTSLEPGRGIESPIFSLALQPDGEVLVGNQSRVIGGVFVEAVGVFTFVNESKRYGSARLAADGSFDGTFVPDTDFRPDLMAYIQPEDCVDDPRYGCEQVAVAIALLPQADGKVLVGGYVQTTIAGDEVFIQSNRLFLDRFNADGTRDTSFEMWIGEALPSTEAIRAMAVRPDGKILVGGSFRSIKNTNRSGIARLQPNGSLDASFDPGTGITRVDSIALQTDGRILIGGSFTTINGTSRNGIARLESNGSLDMTFNPGTGANASVSSVLVQPDGRVLIGGSFTTFNGTVRNRIARLNADGSVDSSFDPGTGADDVVRAVLLQPDGNVLIAGDFTVIDGVTRRYVARLFGDAGEPSNRLPTATIISPTSGSIYTASGSVDVDVEASDSDGTVVRVDLYVDGTFLGSDDTSPFQLRWENVLPGTHSLAVDAIDNSGAKKTSAPVNVVFATPNLPPTVAISSPASGSIFAAPANVDIDVEASDTDGTVVRVDFYAGSTVIASDTAPPFQLGWDNISAGNYSLTATATDDLGATSTSAPVSITVTAPPLPLAPTNLTARAISSTRIKLRWIDHATDETSYQVERAMKGKPFEQIAQLSANATVFLDRGLKPGKKYLYRVRASATADSHYSNTAKAKTLP